MNDHLFHENDQKPTVETEGFPGQTGPLAPAPFVAEPPVQNDYYVSPAQPGMPMSQPVHQSPAYAPPMPPVAPPVPAKIHKGVPGMTVLGFTLALLSLFIMPFFKEAFSNYLFYDGNQEVLLKYYYYATWILGGMAALFSLIGLVFSLIGGSLAKRRQVEGRGLSVAGTIIALVALLLVAGVAVSHYLLFKQIFPS